MVRFERLILRIVHALLGRQRHLFVDCLRHAPARGPRKAPAPVPAQWPAEPRRR